MPPKRAVSKPAARPVKPTTTASKAPAAKKTTVPSKGATGKKPATTPAKGKATTTTSQSKAAPTPVAKKWTKEDDAARKIQTLVRGFLGRCTLKRLRKEKEEYEEKMEQLEKEAFVYLVKMEQEQAEKQFMKEQEEKRKIKQMIKRQKRVLEAAFDGDNDEIRTVLKEVSDLDDKDGVSDEVVGRAMRAKHLHNMVECEDANGNTPLSEASSGGNADTVKMLIDLGADPNSHGQFRRTPLYRAAFAGHLDACQVLLQHGADPRLFAEDGQMPEHVASEKYIVELFETWNPEQTEHLLKKLEHQKEQRLELDRKRRIAETTRLEDEVDVAHKDQQMHQRKLCKATEELNKRIYEHDEAVASGFPRANEVTLPMIHDAEAEVEFCKLHIIKATELLSGLRLQLREQQSENTGDQVGENDFPGLKVSIRELDDVLLRDVGNRIKDSEKWPLIIDPSGQACLFLRYRDINYLNSLNPMDMEPDKIRLGLLGAIRYGKPLVLDMMEVDMFDTVGMKMDAVMPRLLDLIMDGSIIQDELYCKLIRDGDDAEYQKNKFTEQRVMNFRLFIITKNPFPPEALLDQTYPIRVQIPQR